MTIRFMILVIDAHSGSATSSEMLAIDAFNEELRSRGHWILAGGLAAPSQSKLIDNRDGQGRVENRSLFATDEHYSGFWLIQCESLAHAQQLALEGSRACRRRVELRSLLGSA